MSKSLDMVKLAVAALEDKKAREIKIINIEKISTLADYFVIAGGLNRNQVQAMCDSVQEKIGRAGGYPDCRLEGYDAANWILMDYGDIVLHLFDEENRLFYDLERIWRDGSQLSLEELKSL